MANVENKYTYFQYYEKIEKRKLDFHIFHINFTFDINEKNQLIKIKTREYKD